jgi:lipoate-protein ligase B
MKELLVVDLGVLEYGAAWELQRRVVGARKAGNIPDVLLLCEHPHVITLGRSGKINHLRAPDEMLRQMGVSFFETNRGGDITYHGPGQLVGYPILNLGEIRRDVGWYVRGLEEAMIRATAEFGIASRRVAGRTGVWVDVAASAREEVEEVKEI